MDKQRKKQIKRYIAWAATAALVLLLAVMPLLASGSGAQEGPQASILHTTPQRRTIETRLIGGGQISGSTTDAVTIPEAIKLTDYLVGNGDTVKAGDPIARVDKVTVMAALAEVQETLDYLAGEMADAAAASRTETVTAQAGGLVKILYGQTGEDVREVMLRDGALAVLSLDGRMSVTIQRNTSLVIGDTVCVTFPDDTETEGRVESTAGGVLTVSLADEDYAIGETVTVTTEDGDRLGRGTLAIHSPWLATASDGIIAKVNVREGDTLKAGRILFQLERSGQSTELKLLQSQRQEYEELMQELFSLYRSGVVSAPCDGLVTGVDTDGTFLLTAQPEQTWQVHLLRNVTWEESSISLLNWFDPSWGGNTDEDTPDSTPEEEEPGEEEEDSILIYYEVVKLETTSITLKKLNTEETLVLENVTTYPDGTQIQVGDLVTLSQDGTTISPIGGSTSDEDPSGEMGNTGNMGSMGGMAGMGGMGSGAAQPAFEPYSLETLTIASVTSQQEMTLEITVDEQDIARVARGQEAVVTVEALTGQQFPAIVTSIGNTGTNEGGSSKFTVKLTLGKSGSMLPGMNACAYLTLEEARDVLCVPAAALTESGSKTLLYTGYDEKAGVLTNPVEVTTGVSDGEWVQILSDLPENTEILYTYYDAPESGLVF